MPTAIELDQQCLSLAEREQDTGRIIAAHRLLVGSWFFHGEPARAHEDCEHGIALYDFEQHRSLAFVYGIDPGVTCLSIGAWALWYLGYPDQALRRSQAAVALARRGAHPSTLACALDTASWLHFYRQEGQAACTLADEAIALSNTYEFPHWLAMGLQRRGEALIELGQWEEGTAQLQQGREAYQATGALLGTRGCSVAELARGYAGQGRIEEGLQMLAEALAVANETGVRHYEAEMYRLKGKLTLQSQASLGQVKTGQNKSEDTEPRPLNPDPQGEAEACFLKAIEIAQRQKAKSWELRATTSLARLWQQQGKLEEAHDLLSVIYGWFTEGFDTKDLQEAKTLLEELSSPCSTRAKQGGDDDPRRR
jgi:predicted ATPase